MADRVGVKNTEIGLDVTTKKEQTDPRITRRDMSWDAMFEALIEFRAQYGHCNVPLNFEANPTLGRWVTTQRFRSKVNALSPERIRQLSDIDFIWSVGDANWERMFDELKRIRQSLGHCNIPAKWAENSKLATWVTNQRHKKKKGVMSPERVGKLETLGFCWSAYGAGSGHTTKCRNADREEDHPCPDSTPPPILDPDPESTVQVDEVQECSGERLYNIAPNVYVQYGGEGPVPSEFKEYIDSHCGDWPPYIPLPDKHTVFLMGNPFMARRRRIVWSGQGKLDPEILDFVADNGVLPDRE